jgi:hypothetical protein
MESALGGVLPIQVFQTELLRTCSSALRLPRRDRNMTTTLRTTVDVGMRGFGRESVTSDSFAGRSNTFLA